MKPIVYFSREITPEKVLELYRALGKELPGKIAVKVHSGGTTTDQNRFGDSLPAQDVFLAGMADAASAVVDYFHGSMAFVNVMKNLSVDCDCCAVAEDPCMKDIGILASLDPVAVDQACIDLIYAATDDPGQKHFIERVESRHGIHTIECAAALGVGSREYELVELQK